MIRHKKYHLWIIEGNLDWKNGYLDAREAAFRGDSEETLEQEHLFLEPDAWDLIDPETGEVLLKQTSPGSHR